MGNPHPRVPGTILWTWNLTFSTFFLHSWHVFNVFNAFNVYFIFYINGMYCDVYRSAAVAGTVTAWQYQAPPAIKWAQLHQKHHLPRHQFQRLLQSTDVDHQPHLMYSDRHLSVEDCPFNWCLSYRQYRRPNRWNMRLPLINLHVYYFHAPSWPLTLSTGSYTPPSDHTTLWKALLFIGETES